ncbi:MAG TPA: hypothetical protein VMX17_07950 [Candidatus Glassbacteria bacterium]|nr:hypothetical protein [Candidatus Glassbacteria bacterium]
MTIDDKYINLLQIYESLPFGDRTNFNVEYNEVLSFLHKNKLCTEKEYDKLSFLNNGSICVKIENNIKTIKLKLDSTSFPDSWEARFIDGKISTLARYDKHHNTHNSTGPAYLTFQNIIDDKGNANVIISKVYYMLGGEYYRSFDLDENLKIFNKGFYTNGQLFCTKTNIDEIFDLEKETATAFNLLHVNGISEDGTINSAVLNCNHGDNMSNDMSPEVKKMLDSIKNKIQDIEDSKKDIKTFINRMKEKEKTNMDDILKEEIKPTFKEKLVSEAKEDAIETVWRAGTTQAIRGIRDSMCLGLEKTGQTKAAEFLRTSHGEMLVSFIIGVGLPIAPIMQDNPNVHAKVLKFSKEARVRAETEAVTMLMDPARNAIFKAIEDAMNKLPEVEEESKQLHQCVAPEVVEEFVEEYAEVQDRNQNTI